MAVRVTGGMIQSQILSNINSNLNRLSVLQNQSSSGLKLNKPSDDPVGITYSLRYRKDLSQTNQYQENNDAAQSWLNMNDTVLGQAGDIMTHVKELAIQASNETNNSTGLTSIASELKQLKEQMVNIANSQITGKYLFNGQKFNEAPYDSSTTGIDPSQVTTDTGGVNYVIGSGVELPININGNDVFGAAGASDNVFTLLDNMINGLSSGVNSTAIAQMDNITTRTTAILNQRSLNGARTNRVELMQARLDSLSTNLSDLQSKTEDADIEDVIIKATTAQTVYQASLSVGAKLVQRSLVDYLS